MGRGRKEKKNVQGADGKEGKRVNGLGSEAYEASGQIQRKSKTEIV